MTRPIQPRLETTIYKNKSSTDSAQVPASATLEFYKAGATVQLEPDTDMTIPASSLHAVRNAAMSLPSLSWASTRARPTFALLSTVKKSAKE
jgi:hypothetical protein